PHARRPGVRLCLFLAALAVISAVYDRQEPLRSPDRDQSMARSVSISSEAASSEAAGTGCFLALAEAFFVPPVVAAPLPSTPISSSSRAGTSAVARHLG